MQDNLVTRYWKGIGVFVDAEAEINNNFIEDIVTWGIALWSAGEGTAGAIVGENIIYRTGACGASISLSSNTSGGRFRNNVIVESGQNPRYDDPDYYCTQTALAIHSLPETFTIDNNLFYNNRYVPGDLTNYDFAREDFFEKLEFKCRDLSFHLFSDLSQFVKSFCN